MKQYGKLVRDQVPAIMRAAGEAPEVVKIPDEAFPLALTSKLREAVDEYAADPTGESLVDILELTRTLAERKFGMDATDLEAMRTKVAGQRGGYGGRQMLTEKPS